MFTIPGQMRSIHFIAVIGLILFCAYPHVFYGQEGGPFQLCERSVFCPAESLVYEVSWLGIKLGQVRLITGFPTIDSGRVTYHAAAFIDSYSGLPFVDLHAFDYSNFDSSFHSSASVHPIKKTTAGFRNIPLMIFPAASSLSKISPREPGGRRPTVRLSSTRSRQPIPCWKTVSPFFISQGHSSIRKTRFRYRPWYIGNLA